MPLQFLSIKTVDELAGFLGFANYEAFKGLIYPSPRYETFHLQKRSGGQRTINAPLPRLKLVQKVIAANLLDAYQQKRPIAHSFLKGKSILSNALQHCSRRVIVRIDLEDFFPSINFGRVRGVFLKRPFEFPPAVASVLAQICTFQDRLPQGAPTSPILSNFVLRGFDRECWALAKRCKARYTRYADDLTFSLNATDESRLPRALILRVEGAPMAGLELSQLIEKARFKVNESKTRLSTFRSRQLVTGLVVNNKVPTVPSQFHRTTRVALYAWGRFGYAEAASNCLPWLRHRRYRSGSNPELVNALRGRLAFLKMVRGASDPIYLRLANKFNALISRDVTFLPPVAPLKIDPAVRSSSDAFRGTWYLEAGLETGGEAEGSAFRIENNRWITAAHCVGDHVKKTIYSVIEIASSDGAIKMKMDVGIVDWDRDLAVLVPNAGTAPPDHPAYFQISKREVIQGETVEIIGYPQQVPNQPASLMTASVTRVLTRSSVRVFDVDKQILKGNSGGPVIDEKFSVVGVAIEGTSGLTGTNRCACIAELVDHPLEKLKKKNLAAS